MKKNKETSLIRLYIVAISIIRTLILLLAGTNGFSMYFPRIDADYNLVLSMVVLIMFWFIGIFFESVKPAIVWIAFLLDGFMSYFCGMNIYRQYRTINIYEAICFGHVIFIIIDILFIIYLVNRQYKENNRRKYLR